MSRWLLLPVLTAALLTSLQQIHYLYLSVMKTLPVFVDDEKRGVVGGGLQEEGGQRTVHHVLSSSIFLLIPSLSQALALVELGAHVVSQSACCPHKNEKETRW